MKTFEALRLLLTYSINNGDLSAIMYVEHPETGELSPVRVVDLIDLGEDKFCLGLNVQGRAKALTVGQVWRKLLSRKSPDLSLRLVFPGDGGELECFEMETFCTDGGMVIAVPDIEYEEYGD